MATPEQAAENLYLDCLFSDADSSVRRRIAKEIAAAVAEEREAWRPLLKAVKSACFAHHVMGDRSSFQSVFRDLMEAHDAMLDRLEKDT